jgi:hypothetical protein
MSPFGCGHSVLITELAHLTGGEYVGQRIKKQALPSRGRQAVADIRRGCSGFKGMHGRLFDKDLPKSNDATLVIHLS